MVTTLALDDLLPEPASVARRDADTVGEFTFRHILNAKT